MVICKYFLRGTCRFGESCKNEHAYNTENSSSVLRKKQDIEPSVLIKSVSNDMDKAEKGNQWPLSCYGPFQGKPSFPGFEDKCFEEIRLGMYEAERNGTVEQYKQQLTLILQEARMKMRSLQNPTPEAMNMLKDLFNSNYSETGGENGFQNTQTNVFGNSAASNQTNSVFANTVGKTANQSIFATQPTATNTASNFTFALPENKSIFGNTNNLPSSGSIFNQPAPNQSFQSNSIFGVGGASTTVGQSIFANIQPQPPAFPGNNVFQNNPSVFTQSPATNPPPFGAPNQTNSNSSFVPQNPGQNNSPFGIQNQPATNSPFAPQSQPVNNAPFGQQNPVGSNSPFAPQQSQPPSNSPFAMQQIQAPSNSPFAPQQNQTASNSPFAPQQNQAPANAPFASQTQVTGNSPFAVPANQSPFSQNQIPANQSPFAAPQSQAPFAAQNSAPTNPSLFTSQNQTATNPPPFGAQPNFAGNIFSNAAPQGTNTANQGSLFRQATSPVITENKSIFAQQSTTVTGGSIFGNTVQPQTIGQQQATVFNSQNQVTPLNHTKSIFGTPQTNTGVKIQRQDDVTVYSKLENLSDVDRNCYEAHSFEFSRIPEKAPALQLCS